jgi:hypothetical protein
MGLGELEGEPSHFSNHSGAYVPELAWNVADGSPAFIFGVFQWFIRMQAPSSKETLANIGPISDQDKNIGPILDQY